MSISLKDVARHLQSKGRYGDTELVHLNPIEVDALKKLSPTGELTINPDTGLQEAFLPALIPIIGGLAGSAFLPSAAAAMGWGGMSAALGGAIGSGLASFASTGDLTKGVTTGLLGYGIGSALGGLAGAAGDAAANTAGSVASDTMAGWGEAAAGDKVGQLIGQNAIPESAVAASVPTTSALNVAKSPGFFDSLFGGSSSNSQPKGVGTESGGSFTDKAMKAAPIAMMGLGALGGGEGGATPPVQPYQPTYPFPGNRTSGQRYLGPGTPDPEGRERTYFGYKDGGKVSPRKGAGLSVPGTFDEKRFNELMDQYQDAQGKDFEEAVKHRQRYLKDMGVPHGMRPTPEVRFEGGGPVSGPGGGLDDAIPAVINGRQPAALSSGEYVVPAHAVSGLGDGSTEAGVAKLDAMVDTVMKHKFGTTNRKPAPISKMGGEGAVPFARGGGVDYARLIEGRGTTEDMLRAYALLMDDDRPVSRGMDQMIPMVRSSRMPEREIMVERPDPTNPGDDDLESAREKISRVESGGRYDALGPMVGKDRAYGRYQVMGANIPSWTKDALGRSLTAEEYLADKKAQDAVFNHRFGGYMRKYGPKGAARAWFAGEGGMNNYGAKDVLGTSVADYERKFGG